MLMRALLTLCSQGDPMRLLFSKSATPHHGFAAYYTYLEKIFQADAVLHFGTHGSLEFMPGKQVSNSEGSLSTRVSLLGSMVRGVRYQPLSADDRTGSMNGSMFTLRWRCYRG